jgi:mono/diheme cytochrome c family protein
MRDIVKNIKKTVLATFAMGVIGAVVMLPSPKGALGSEACDALYKAKCAICHGADGSGNTANGKKLNVRDLRSPEVQKMSDEKLSEVIAVGKGKMPGYEKTLGKDKVSELVSYTRELAKKR